jgi:hypothetical protein
LCKSTKSLVIFKKKIKYNGGNNRMKRKILSAFVLFSMLMSMFITDTSFLRTEVAAAAASTPLELTMLHNGAEIGRDFNSFVTGGSITIQSSDPSAEIFFTTSDVQTHNGANMRPNARTSGAAGFQNVPIGIHQDIINRVMNRHGGGVSPSRSSTRYSSAIAIPSRQESVREVFTISAVAFRGNDVARITRTFILIPVSNPRVTDWRKAHGELMIVSIYSDSYGLFDHTDGILVPGLIREEWISEYQRLNTTRLLGRRPWHDGERTRPDFVDPGIMEAYGPTIPANFNKRGRGINPGTPHGGAEKPAFVELFTPDGMRHVAQSAGIRVKGGWSRGTNLYEQRTFEFYARNGYNDYYGGGRTDRFTYPLFGQQHTLDEEGSTGNIDHGNLIHRYRRWRVRNGGSDRDRAYLRDELACTLWTQAGFATAQNFRPAVVFLNGAYYGFVFMKSPRTENHWDRMYRGRESRFHQIGSNEMGTVGCNGGSDSCGRVIMGSPGTSWETQVPSVRNQGESGIQNADGILIAGVPANTYRGMRPHVCGETGRCSGSRQARCREFHTTKDSMCENYTQANCDRRRRGAGTGVTCTGCRASCDWAEIVDLILGRDAQTLAGNNLPAMQQGGRSEARRAPMGLTNPARWEEFQLRVDVDYLLHYYAMNIYAGNIDWPANNMEWWRYFPDADELAAIERGELHPHLDGKWRPIPQDLEMGWGIWTTGTNASATATAGGYNNIEALIQRNGVLGGVGHYGANMGSFMMRALMGDGARGSGVNQQPAITIGPAQMQNRLKLANVFSDLLEGAVRPQNAQTVHSRIQWFIAGEHELAVSSGGDQGPLDPNRRISEIARPVIQFGNNMPTGSRWYTWPRWTGGDDGAHVMGEHESINRFLGDSPISTATSNGHQLRIGGRANVAGGVPAHIGATLSTPDRALQWGGRSMTVAVTVSGPGNATLNTRPIGVEGLAWSGTTGPNHDIPVPDPRSEGRGTAVTGRYWPGSQIPVKAHPAPGFRAVWSGTGFTIPAAGTTRIMVSSAATVNIAFERCPEYAANGNVTIGAVKAESFNSQANDWIQINNHTDRAVSTKGLFLTDSNSDDWKWQMPSFIIRAGSSVRIKTSDHDAGGLFLKRAQTNFNLGFDERLRLVDAEGTVMERVDITILGPNQIQQRDSYTDGRFRVYPIRTAADQHGNWNDYSGGAVVPGMGVIGAASPGSASVPPPPPPPPCPHGVSPATNCQICNPPAGSPVWTLNFAQLTAAGGGGSAGAGGGANNIRSLGSASYQPGVRRESGDNNPMFMNGTTSFTWQNTHSGSRGLNIETGLGVGGTAGNWTAADGFNPIPGTTYRIEITVSGSGRLRVFGNRVVGGSSPGSADRTDTNLTASPQTISHTWTQGQGNVYMELDTGSGHSATITSIRIVRA